MKLVSVLLLCVFVAGTALASEKAPSFSSSARLSGSNELLLPANYHSWVVLSPSAPGIPKHTHKHVASKVFVEPTAFEHFNKTGQWPNRTVIVLEMRNPKAAKHTCALMALEAAVKDDSNLAEPWSYYGIIYDRITAQRTAAPLVTGNCEDCEHPTDFMLAMAVPTLRAVINAKPSTVSPTLF
ncbi:MAG TPA: cytochrome P460 family protein [Terriglobales bacterium]|nr:cytochrome P460 family protein [Terriglobales bacterium]